VRGEVDQITMDMIQHLLVPGLAFAAAFGGVKVSLNGTRDTVRRIERKLDSIDEKADENRLEIARIQGRCALLHPPTVGAPASYPVEPRA
jgi:hypothetical protein